MRVAFLRSPGPTDPVNALWVLDVATGEERLVADPYDLDSGPRRPQDGEVSAAERARRERVRELASGIVSYDTDADLATAAFTHAGRLWRASLVDQGSVPEVVPSMSAPFDPRISPNARQISFVSGSALRVTGRDALGGDRVVIDEPADTVTWGSAEFVAAEEMGRTRGHWWSPDSTRLLAARVDNAPVDTWWIANPVSPSSEPTQVRYPAAGRPNAAVSLAIFGADTDTTDASQRVDVHWDRDGWEYLADARWSAEGLLLVVQSRDQRGLGVLAVDTQTGACDLLYDVRDECWVELVAGVPALHGGRLVTVEDRGTARRLCIDSMAITSYDVQVRGVHHIDDDALTITASVDPTEIQVARVSWQGEIEWLTREPGVHGVAIGGGTTVIWRRSLQQDGCIHEVYVTQDKDSEPSGASVSEFEQPGESGLKSSWAHSRVLRSEAAPSGLELNVQILELGPRGLRSALVLPANPPAVLAAETEQSPQEQPIELPVLCDPYGGPHFQRVQKAEALFQTSQWFADQGFAVLVTDGRGTPGRGPAFEREVWGDLAGPVLADQIDALDHAAQLFPQLDLSRVGIRGWSFGGYLAALAVLRRPDIFGAAIAGAPVTDWRFYDTHYTERYLGHPDQEPANYERTAALPAMDGVHRPLMIIHGMADDNVVVAHSLRLSRALTEAGYSHSVLPLSGVTHMTPQEEVAENLLLVQLHFLRQALGIDN